jgi:hypothetical protein
MFERVNGLRLDPYLPSAGVAMQKVLYQQRNILDTLPQRRNDDGINVDSIIEIRAEELPVNKLLEVHF